MAEEVGGQNFPAEPIEIGDDDGSDEYYEQDQEEEEDDDDDDDDDDDPSDDESSSGSSGRNSPQYAHQFLFVYPTHGIIQTHILQDIDEVSIR
jgi:hypothetical protein